jgi:prepilin-type N-terminal cleavage/methylation domain-containing protein
MITPNRRSGFTLIELVVVVTIIGILASLSVVRFGNTKQRAIEAKMRTDLRTLSTQQEAHFIDNESFSTSSQTLGFSPSEGFELTIIQGDVTGWSAMIRQKGVPTPMCAVYFANATPVAPAEQEGTITCQ